MPLTAVIPGIVQQGTTPIISIEGQDFGTADGSPTFVLNGESVAAKVLTPIGSPFEVLEVALTATMTATAGNFTFDIVPPPTSGFPTVSGPLIVQASVGGVSDIIKQYDETVASTITCGTNTGNGLIGKALELFDSGTGTAEALHAQLVIDLETGSDNMRNTLNGQRDVAIDLINGAGGTQANRQRIRNATQGGRLMIRRIARGFGDDFEKASGIDP